MLCVVYPCILLFGGFNMSPLFSSRIRPAHIIAVGFLLLILTGALLLTLPAATRSGESASFSDALFTATSSTCVTGLVVHDTFEYWSFFGQLVLLLLIQAGGMGVVTMAVAVALIMRRRIGLKQRFVLQEAISAPRMGGIVRMTGFILRLTFALEGLGALLLALRFCPQMGFVQGMWYAVFHSVSAFCNAGFDLMGVTAPYASLTGYVGDPLVSLTIAGLIVAGGLGFFAWSDIRDHTWHLRSYRLQTKLVLSVTAALLLLPALFFYFFEFSQPQWASLTQSERILASVFQSVTPRTAGFNTVNLGLLSMPSVLLMILLMLTGGSPGSTAGGFKTTSLAMLFLSIRAVLSQRDSIQVFHRRIPPEVLRNTVALVMLYVILFLSGGILLCCFDDVSLSQALFECASAIGTVGLTLGITPELSDASRLVLISLMYFGRVGGLTMLYAMTGSHVPVPAQMPQEKIAIG